MSTKGSSPMIEILLLPHFLTASLRPSDGFDFPFQGLNTHFKQFRSSYGMGNKNSIRVNRYNKNHMTNLLFKYDIGVRICEL